MLKANAMKLFMKMPPKPHARLKHALIRLKSHNRGIAAIEFAMVLPLMVLTYVGVGEISELLLSDRKVVTLARSLSDLTAQLKTAADADISTIFSVAAPIMTPFSSSTVKMSISSVMFNTNAATPTVPTALVGWTAVSQGGTARSCTVPLTVVPNNTKADVTNIPSGVAVAGTTVIVADVAYPYVPMFGNNIVPGGAITINQTTYMRPRNVTIIPYTGTAYTNCSANTFTG